MEEELAELFLFVDDFYKLIEKDWESVSSCKLFEYKDLCTRITLQRNHYIFDFYQTSGFKCLYFFLFLDFQVF